MKKVLKTVFFLGALGYSAAIVFKSIKKTKDVTTILNEISEQDILPELFQGSSWSNDFTRDFNIIAKTLCFKTACTMDFLETYPDAEETFKEYLIEHFPGLADMKLSIKFTPQESFDEYQDDQDI